LGLDRSFLLSAAFSVCLSEVFYLTSAAFGSDDSLAGYAILFFISEIFYFPFSTTPLAVFFPSYSFSAALSFPSASLVYTFPFRSSALCWTFPAISDTFSFVCSTPSETLSLASDDLPLEVAPLEPVACKPGCSNS
jgi:hypothetical protein